MRGAGGQVEYVKIMQDFDGRPKVLSSLQHCYQAASAFAHTSQYSLFLQGFGVCEFTSRQDAQDAIEKLDQSELQGTSDIFFMSVFKCR